MNREHLYLTSLNWTGNKGEGTKSYQAYARDFIISAPGKMEIEGSSDPVFRGDVSRYNPEELLVAALSSCHMLWYLHLCADSGIVVKKYTDSATGTMIETREGSGQFREVILHPEVIVAGEDMVQMAYELHHKANTMCFIARSCNFPVLHKPVIKWL